MVEFNSQLRLLSASTLDIYKMFENVYMLSMGIWQYPQTVIPTLPLSDFVVLGHLWSQNGIMSWLRLTATQTASCIHMRTYKVFEHIDMLYMGIRK